MIFILYHRKIFLQFQQVIILTSIRSNTKNLTNKRSKKMKIKSIFKKTSVTIAAFSCLFASSMTANADDYYFIGRVSPKGNYYYDVERNTTNWILFHHNLDACYPIYHVKGYGDTTLAYQRDVSYTKEKSTTFSTSIEASGTIGGIEAAISAGYEQSWTESVQFTKSGSVSQTVPSDSSTGYYKMTLSHNFHKYSVSAYRYYNYQYSWTEYPCVP